MSKRVWWILVVPITVGGLGILIWADRYDPTNTTLGFVGGAMFVLGLWHALILCTSSKDWDTTYP